MLSRKRLFIGLSATTALVVVGVLAAVLIRQFDRIATEQTAASPRSGVGLLATGGGLPQLSRRLIVDGLNERDIRSLDTAVTRGRRGRLLSDLEVYDRSGRVVYSSDRAAVGTRPFMSPEVRGGLGGRSTARRNPSELDRSTNRHTGVLDAVAPLRGPNGRVFGAIEASLRLRPLETQTASVRIRILTFRLGAATLLWLVLLPLTSRAARDIAASWVPGRRRTVIALRRALAKG